MGLKAKPNLTRLSVLEVVVAVAKRGSKQGVEIGEKKATQKGLDMQPFLVRQAAYHKEVVGSKTCVQHLYYGSSNPFSL
jgi:hypothetical protein